MVWWRRTPRKATIDALYGTIVAQARLPAFYAAYGVPDTVEGRFELLVLHQALTARRLAGEPATAALGPALFEQFCRDLDHNLREMGVGDLTVPKKMKGFAEAFFGRARAYDRALTARDRAACTAAVARNVFGLAKPCAGASRLAHYMEEATRALDGLNASDLSQGTLSFPDPAAIPETVAAA
jgi:cytochrome b pre-mRNA-processing protein 3